MLNINIDFKFINYYFIYRNLKKKNIIIIIIKLFLFF